MTSLKKTTELESLKSHLSGELHWDSLHQTLYATDASVYRKLPLAVAYPKNEQDLKKLIQFASKTDASLIPRTAGTSLAGQCVGEGIVVDVSKHFTRILDINEKERTVTVQPGVIRDELNTYLKPFGLFFGPNTSTSNRCMIGGMVGNNSSGTTSIQYGVTRDKVIRLKTLLSDGSEAVFEPISTETFEEKCKEEGLEGNIYRTIDKTLSAPGTKEAILEHFPSREIHRRNTGYAIDELLLSEPFVEDGQTFNMCKLLSGSEGTLAFTTEITLQLDLLPPENCVMVAAHFDSISSCLKAVQPVMEHNLFTCEMMDKTILDCTKDNLTQQKNRFFVEGDPKAILMLEVRAETEKDALKQAEQLVNTLKLSGLSYAFPILKGVEIDKAMELRKAGLGLLGNMVGDRKAVACIEDTAVALKDLSSYISEFTALMKEHGQEAVYYAHAGAGELHLRPILDLKKSEDVTLFRKITEDVVDLVKKYKGSLSGEHGDGIVRAEFIPLIIGEANYEVLKKIKTAFDPQNIFNPGKIVNPPKMDESLRYVPDREEPNIETLLDFSDSEGILRATEKCNGSGDCRKLPTANGAMCPSYHATRDEKHTTRARANALREFLTNSSKANRFSHHELKEVFDLCLSCKACASECPSNVDVAALKVEFLYQYQQEYGSSFRDKFFANSNKWNRLASKFPAVSNALISGGITGGILKKILGVSSKRALPLISNNSLIKSVQLLKNQLFDKNKSLVLFLDEFSKYYDADIAQDAIDLLHGLGYKVHILDHEESGRTFISKGFLAEAKQVANKNVSIFSVVVSSEIPLVGIEPSAILSFRDEYIRLADQPEKARALAENCFMIEEFLKKEIEAGAIDKSLFTDKPLNITFHGHCHQKALGNQEDSLAVLGLPANYEVSVINSGCCGMAGSFGYEKEHYEVSMEVGEQVLFPAIRNVSEATIIAANGTSCRHQIKDGTTREALHPITILRNALK